MHAYDELRGWIPPQCKSKRVADGSCQQHFNIENTGRGNAEAKRRKENTFVARDIPKNTLILYEQRSKDSNFNIPGLWTPKPNLNHLNRLLRSTPWSHTATKAKQAIKSTAKPVLWLPAVDIRDVSGKPKPKHCLYGQVRINKKHAHTKLSYYLSPQLL